MCSDGSRRCAECGEEHDDWTDHGTFVVSGPHHEGRMRRIECGRCGAVDEVSAA